MPVDQARELVLEIRDSAYVLDADGYARPGGGPTTSCLDVRFLITRIAELDRVLDDLRCAQDQ